jgi:hypothetical protein
VDSTTATTGSLTVRAASGAASPPVWNDACVSRRAMAPTRTSAYGAGVASSRHGCSTPRAQTASSTALLPAVTPAATATASGASAERSRAVTSRAPVVRTRTAAAVTQALALPDRPSAWVAATGVNSTSPAQQSRTAHSSCLATFTRRSTAEATTATGRVATSKAWTSGTGP